MSEWQSIIFERRVYSLNRLLNMHWTAKKRLKDSLYTEVLVSHKNRRNGNAEPNKPIKCRVVVTGTRLPKDADNIRGGLKPFMDAAVRVGFLPDDTIELIGTPEIIMERKGKVSVTIQRKMI